jgi:hypothetical protein
MDIHRVITGHAADGTSIFVADETAEPVTVSLIPGVAFHRIWGGDDVPVVPADGEPETHSYFPPPNGFRFGFFTLPPDSVGLPEDLDVGAALDEINEKLPGMMDVMEPGAPGMHTTDTVDFDVVIDGEVWLELDDGKEVRLTPGSCVVQNGTRHAWRNKSDKPVTLAVAIVGARRRQ